MKNRIFTLIATSLLLVGTLLAPYVRADEEDKKTVVTFNEPVQVPGTVLPAGTYVFKLADSQSDRHIVQIFNADESRLFATILAIPDYRTTPSDKTIVTFDQRPSGQPEALRTWFYPGDNYGQEFVYPKQKASELAQVNRRPVPSIPDEATELAAIKTAPATLVDVSVGAAGGIRHFEIVDPTDVSVLRSHGQSELTLITCFPFSYLGRAPKRFIVHAVIAP